MTITVTDCFNCSTSTATSRPRFLSPRPALRRAQRQARHACSLPGRRCGEECRYESKRGRYYTHVHRLCIPVANTNSVWHLQIAQSCPFQYREIVGNTACVTQICHIYPIIFSVQEECTPNHSSQSLHVSGCHQVACCRCKPCFNIMFFQIKYGNHHARSFGRMVR